MRFERLDTGEVVEFDKIIEVYDSFGIQCEWVDAETDERCDEPMRTIAIAGWEIDEPGAEAQHIVRIYCQTHFGKLCEEVIWKRSLVGRVDDDGRIVPDV